MSDDYVKAAPLCEKHQPNGGTRGMCVICAGESLQHALSRISYACEPPNEMQYSSFDVHMDETAVVAQVVAQAERVRVLREALINLRRAYVRLLENGRDRIRMLGGECDPVDKMEQADPDLRDAAAAIRSAAPPQCTDQPSEPQ